jgi:hypothetical protein
MPGGAQPGDGGSAKGSTAACDQDVVHVRTLLSGDPILVKTAAPPKPSLRGTPQTLPPLR